MPFDNPSPAVAAPFAPAAGTFRRRQRVEVTHAAGKSETGRIVRADRQLAGWYIVRFDADGGQLCVSGTNLQAAA